MFLLRASLLVGFVAFVGADPQSYMVHETRDILDPSWARRDRLDPKDVIPLRVGLIQSNLDKGHDLLMDMYVSAALMIRESYLPYLEGLQCLISYET
jgi:hypothetical protein